MGYGNKTEEQHQRTVEAARKGGMATKRNQLAKNPKYYQETGKQGGEKLLREKGKGWFSFIGRKHADKSKKWTYQDYLDELKEGDEHV